MTDPAIRVMFKGSHLEALEVAALAALESGAVQTSSELQEALVIVSAANTAVKQIQQDQEVADAEATEA